MYITDGKSPSNTDIASDFFNIKQDRPIQENADPIAPMINACLRAML